MNQRSFALLFLVHLKFQNNPGTVKKKRAVICFSPYFFLCPCRTKHTFRVNYIYFNKCDLMIFNKLKDRVRQNQSMTQRVRATLEELLKHPSRHPNSIKRNALKRESNFSAYFVICG